MTLSDKMLFTVDSPNDQDIETRVDSIYSTNDLHKSQMKVLRRKDRRIISIDEANK